MSVGAGTGYTIEQLLEMLSCEVARERHLVGVHVEANRTLEAMLRREQQQRQEAVSYVDSLQHQIDQLQKHLADKEAEAKELRKIVAEARPQAQSIPSAPPPADHDDGLPEAVSEDTAHRLRNLLSSLNIKPGAQP